MDFEIEETNPWSGEFSGRVLAEPPLSTALSDATCDSAEPQSSHSSQPPQPPQPLPSSSPLSSAASPNTETIPDPQPQQPRKLPLSGPLGIPITGNLIFGVCVVGFHHARGPEVEYWAGEPAEKNTALWPHLPFQSLPDGAHAFEENFCYFTLLYDEARHISPSATSATGTAEPLGDSVTTFFGISCNRQISSSELPQDAAVTRSTVQKAVVVVVRQPIFGQIKEKLGIVTRAYFCQRDFADRRIIDEFYQSLHARFRPEAEGTPEKPIGQSIGHLVGPLDSQLRAEDFYFGISVRQLLHRLGRRVLVLLKALLLEKKILLYAQSTELLCSVQFALLSLVPNLLAALQPSGSPRLFRSYEAKLVKPQEVQTANAASVRRFIGFPLQLFGRGGMFSPYAPLQQLDDLTAPETEFFLVGTTNALIVEQLRPQLDVAVFLDDPPSGHGDSAGGAHGLGVNRVEIRSKQLQGALQLTALDRRFADTAARAVTATWDGTVGADVATPTDAGYHGSEDYVRDMYEEYLMGLMASVKRDLYGLPVQLEDFNMEWVNLWKGTYNFGLFARFTDEEVFDVVEAHHVGAECSGDIGAFLAGRFAGLQRRFRRLGESVSSEGRSEVKSEGRLEVAAEGRPEGSSNSVVSEPQQNEPKQSGFWLWRSKK